MPADEPGAIFLPVDESRVFINNNNHTWVVLHKTAGAGRAQDIAHFFATDPNMASTHYIVGQDGTVVQCVLEKDGAAGNCCIKGNYAPFLPTNTNLNWWTVSIEHVDPDPHNQTPLTDAQKAASFRLVRNICLRHNIPMLRGDAKGGIIGHCDIDPIDRANCPGNYPWDELFTFLKQGATTMGTPLGWTDDGHVLTAPNKVPIMLGFRQHILQSSWDPANTPLEVEYHADPVLLHNLSVGAGQRQCFRDGLLWYTPAAGVVWEPRMGWELDAAYKALEARGPLVPNLPDIVNHLRTLGDVVSALQAGLNQALKDLSQ